MAAYDYALTTKGRIKDKLGISETGHDDVIDRLIYGATDLIEGQCGGRRFKRTTYTQEIYNGSPLNNVEQVLKWLILNNAPVSSISSFQYRTGLKSNPTWNDFNADDYEEDDEKGIINVSLPRGLQNIRISYVAGYLIDFTDEFNDAAHTLPYELAELCDRLVIRQFKKRKDEGKKSTAFDTSTITWTEQLLDQTDREVIANYRRLHVI